jgi:hypothetical protein
MEFPNDEPIGGPDQYRGAADLAQQRNSVSIQMATGREDVTVGKPIIVRTDESSGTCVKMATIKKGTVFTDMHFHTAIEEGILLEGSVVRAGRTFHAPCYWRFPSKVPHGYSEYLTDCRMMTWFSGPWDYGVIPKEEEAAAAISHLQYINQLDGVSWRPADEVWASVGCNEDITPGAVAKLLTFEQATGAFKALVRRERGYSLHIDSLESREESANAASATYRYVFSSPDSFFVYERISY